MIDKILTFITGLLGLVAGFFYIKSKNAESETEAIKQELNIEKQKTEAAESKATVTEARLEREKKINKFKDSVKQKTEAVKEKTIKKINIIKEKIKQNKTFKVEL